MDNFKYFPRYIAECGDLVLSKSQITGKMLIAGKLPDKNQSIDKIASPIDKPASFIDKNASSMDNPASFEDNSTRIQNTTVSTRDIDPVLKAIYNCDAPNPVKRCMKCASCVDCKKVLLPSEEKNLEMTKILQKNIRYSEDRKIFCVDYIYNSHLAQLPTYEKPVLNMQMNLEKRLLAAGEEKTSKFNENVDDFFKRGVLEWVPQEETDSYARKVSYIPLTYAEKAEGTTKLRVCGNSSFSVSKNCSLNQAMIPGPNVMTSLVSCLLSFRTAWKIGLGDISKMFHAVETEPKTNDLRRVWVKRQGMGSSGKFERARFARVSFGDLLAPAFAILVLGKAITMFIQNKQLQSRLL